MNNQLIVALSYTKQRTVFGMVGIEIDAEKKIAYVRLAKQWSRDNMSLIPKNIETIYNKVKWDMTFADQLIGQHLIRSIELALGFEVQTITTQKNLKDPENIEKIKVMDMTEMTQFTLSLKQQHSIQFPPKNITDDMRQLVKQIEMFTEHITESGTVSYYAPGGEYDCLSKALMICCFVGRMSLQHEELPMIIRQGHTVPKTITESEEEFFEKVLGENYTSLSSSHLNRANKNRLFAPKRFDF